MVSVVFDRSEILHEEVYLFEKIGTENREVMAHLQAICFLRPIEANLIALGNELRKPKYGSYYIFFTNAVSESYLNQLARHDEHEVVKEVQEFYVDYYAINSDTFSLNLRGCLNMNSYLWNNELVRMTDGITACLLSLKMKPAIRAQKSSKKAVQLAQSVKNKIEMSSTFHLGRRQQTPLLLIMDRAEDPVTPLLTSWTYQAMLHHLIGIDNGVVDLRGVEGVSEELSRFVVSQRQDDFFLKTMYQNFGDLGISLKDFADDFQAKSKSHKSLESIDDIKKFVETYPDFKRESGNVTKHVTLVEELHNRVQKRNLLEVSKVEQKLACHEDHDNAVQSIRSLLDGNSGTITGDDALRLILLYTLRYQTHPNNQAHSFVSTLLSKYNVDPERAKVIKIIKEFSDASKQTTSLDLFENQKWMSSMRGKIKRGLVGITNVFTQHMPLLHKILSLLMENKLEETSYPYYLGKSQIPTDVIVFVIGGITYEEAAIINKLNVELSGSFNFLLGGTSIHNANSFMDDLLDSTT